MCCVIVELVANYCEYQDNIVMLDLFLETLRFDSFLKYLLRKNKSWINSSSILFLENKSPQTFLFWYMLPGLPLTVGSSQISTLRS